MTTEISSEYEVSQRVVDTFMGYRSGIVTDITLVHEPRRYCFVYTVKLDSNGEHVRILEENLRRYNDV
jgi:hypothetical protein